MYTSQCKQNKTPLEIMAVDIILPQDAARLRDLFLENDLSLVHGCLRNCRKRQVIFSTEVITGFIIHTSSPEAASNAPQKAYLTSNYIKDTKGTPFCHSDSALVAGDFGIEGTNQSMGRGLTTVILKLRLLGIVTDATLKSQHVIVWMFTTSFEPIQHQNIRLRLTASIRRNSSVSQHKPVIDNQLLENKPLPPIQDDSVLIDDSTTEILDPNIDDRLSYASAEAYVCAPLLLNLKCANLGMPGSNEKSFFLTVIIQVPLIPPHVKENLFINIHSLTATSNGAKIMQIGSISFPKRCSVEDVLHVTYRVSASGVAFDFGPDSIAKGLLKNASRITLSLKILGNFEYFNKNTKKYDILSSVLSISWSPTVDTLNPQKHPFTGQGKPSLTHPSPGKGSLVASPFASGNKSPKSGTLVAFSSPSLSVTKSGGNLKNKLYRSVTLLPGSALTVNLNFLVPPSSALSGVRLSFSGKLCLSLGEVQSWKLQVINSGIRNLKLHITSKRIKANTPLYSQPNNSSYVSSIINPSISTKRGDTDSKGVRFRDNTIAYSPLQLYHRYISLKPAKNGLMLLTFDTDLGNLEPGQVYETEVKLVGFVKGIHNLEGLRIFDSTSGEGMELGRFLEVFVV